MYRFFVAAVLVFGMLAVGGPSASADVTALVVPVGSPLAAGFQSLGLSASGDIHGVGGGWVDGRLQKFDLSAHEGPKGDFGQVDVTQTGPTGLLEISYRLDVDCVHIHGPASPGGFDRGVISGVVKKVEPSPNTFDVDLGDRLTVLIKDGGNESGSLPVDDFVATHMDIAPGFSCKGLVYGSNLDNVTQGNVVIKLD